MSQKDSRIHINRAGQSLGTFTSEEVQLGLDARRFVGADLAWQSGMENWRPLHAWPEFSIPQEPAPPLAELSRAAVPPVLPPGLASARGTGPAWEHRDEIGWLQALGLTIKDVLLEPAAVFARMKQDGGLTAPLLYYILTGLISGIFALAYNFIYTATGQRDLSHLPPALRQMMEPGDLSAGYLIGMVLGTLILAPFLLTILSLVQAGIAHLCLMVLGGATKPFEATYRVIAYAWGSSRMLNLLPICGQLVGLVWGLVGISIGLAKVHETETWRAVLAVLLPMVLFCGLILSLAALLFGLISQST